MKVIVTIPAYNEERTISPVIKEIFSALKQAKHDHAVIVIDDGSTDRTREVAERAGAIVYSNKRNSGLAVTFAHEMRRCAEHKADIIVHTDADGQYPASVIPTLVKEIEKGADLVLGTRFGKGRYAGSWMNKLGNRMFARVFSGLLGQRITDTTTGFRAFTREVAALPLINDFTYTQEQLLRAGKKHMKIVEVPIHAAKTRESRLFRNPLHYAVRAWINILRIYRDFAPLRFFGAIGGMFLLLGFLLGIWIVVTLVQTGMVGGIPRVVLSALLILTGIQIWLFGFLADMQRVKE